LTDANRASPLIPQRCSVQVTLELFGIKQGEWPQIFDLIRIIRPFRVQVINNALQFLNCEAIAQAGANIVKR